jgi:hypothetical protein
MPAKETSAACQPKFPMTDCAAGASTTVPSEPTAATRPTRWMRFSGGVARATTPISTPKPVPAMPMPQRKPARSRPSAPRDTTISARPAA